MSKISASDVPDEVPPEPVDLSKDEIFTQLANQRRRYVLHYLKRNEGTAELGDMASQIAAWENDVTVEELTSQQRKRVYTSLQQTHLKKMDEAGIIEYDASRGTIESTADARTLEVYLEIVPGHEFAWRELYLALGAISSALVIVVWQGVYPFSMLPALAWAGVIAMLISIASSAHVYYERHMRLGASERPVELEFNR